MQHLLFCGYISNSEYANNEEDDDDEGDEEDNDGDNNGDDEDEEEQEDEDEEDVGKKKGYSITINQAWHTTGHFDDCCRATAGGSAAWNSRRAWVVSLPMIAADAASSWLDGSYLHGNMVLPNFSGMHIEATTDWNTVSRSETNPSSINSR